METQKMSHEKAQTLRNAAMQHLKSFLIFSLAASALAVIAAYLFGIAEIVKAKNFWIYICTILSFFSFWFSISEANVFNKIKIILLLAEEE